MRRFVVDFSRNLAQENGDKFAGLNSRLTDLERRVQRGENLSALLDEARAGLEEFLSHQAQGAKLRAQVREAVEGERSTAYFLRKERVRGQQKLINAIRRRDGTVVTSRTDVMNVWSEFYFRLFSSQELSEGDQGLFLDSIERRLTPAESRLCEGDLTIEECSKALSNMPSAKSPGVDGFPAEFFRRPASFYEDEWLAGGVLVPVRTVKDIPISSQCIPKRRDVEKWPHLQNVDLHEVDEDKVLHIIGLKEHPQLFLPLEYKAGEAGEPIGVRYGLGWTIMESVGCPKEGLDCSVNLLVSSTSGTVNPSNDVQSRSGIARIRENVVEFSRPIEERAGLAKETEFEDYTLKQKIEGLWKTDFGDTLVNTRPSHSVEDKRALEIMENSFVKVNGHYQVALLWRSYPPHLHDNRELAAKRCELLKRRLLKDGDLAIKYKAAMNDYMEKGHAERVPDEESRVLDKPVWYLPHHPVTHPLKPEKVRVVYDCAAKYNQTSLNDELLQGPDETNRLVGVISRFRMESIGVVADIESMFNQVIVDPKDRDVLRFLWWPDGDLSKDLAEYRMTKHVFGAKSSPSIADFCVKKTAELESDGIESDVVNTVKRNMYEHYTE